MHRAALVAFVAIGTTLATSGAADAQPRSRSGTVALEGAAVLLADAVSAGAGLGVYALVDSIPCDDHGDGIGECNLTAVLAALATAHLVALFAGPAAADIAGGSDGRYWAALGWGALGMAIGLAAGIALAAALFEVDGAAEASLLGLPVIGHVIGTVAGYESSVPPPAQLGASIAPTGGGASVVVHAAL